MTPEEAAVDGAAIGARGCRPRLLSQVLHLRRVVSHERVILGAILLVAAFFRFYRLYQTPPGFHFDQAFNAFDILRLMLGQFAIFFPANTGREPLFIYLQIVGVELFGPTSFGLRLVSAVIGLVTIPLIYGFAKTLFRSVGIATLATLIAAISFWHIFYSRDGLRVILEVPLTLGTFWFFWRALVRLQSRDFQLAGVFTALGIYTYTSGRLLPIALIVLAIWAALSDRPRAREYAKGLAWSLGVAAIIALPLGIYFAIHPDEFISHTARVSILSPDVSGGNVAVALARNIERVLGMFLIDGDGNPIRNLPGRPVFDPLIGSLFVVGVATWLAALFHPRSTRRVRQRSIFLATWMGLALATSLFSVDAPDFLRTLPGLPAVMMLPAWGAGALWQQLRLQTMRRSLLIVLGVMVTASATLTYRDYFIAFAESPDLYYSYNQDLVEVSDWINQNAHSAHLFLAPLFYQQGTVSLLTRNAPLRSFESRDTIVLPSSSDGRDALFGYPLGQEARVQTLAERLGGIGTRQDLFGSIGTKLLLVYRVPAAKLPSTQDPLTQLEQIGGFVKPQHVGQANWDNQMELLGYTVTASDAPKRNLEVTLMLQSLAPMTKDYTFSVQVLDSKNRIWGQEDKMPGDNSYATSQWGLGDVVAERFYPGLEACAPAGDYHITADLYDPQTMRTLALTNGGGTTVALGTTHADTAPSNRLADLLPDETTDLNLGPGMQLMGFSLAPQQLHAGDAFSLELFWRGRDQTSSSRPLTVQLRDAAQHDFTLIDTRISVPPAGRGVCTQFDLTAPPGLAPGVATISANQTKFSSVHIAP